MVCAVAGYITVIILGVMSSCVDEMGCDALGKVELVVIPVAKACFIRNPCFQHDNCLAEIFRAWFLSAFIA